MTDTEMLDRLIKFFWYDDYENPKGFEWSYREGTTVAAFDLELNKALEARYPDKVK